MTLIKITPNKKRINSLIKMAISNIKMVETISHEKFPSNVLKEYYGIIRELMSAKMLSDGLKTYGEGSHKEVINYIKNKGHLNIIETDLVDKLRILRNEVVYEGKVIDKKFLDDKLYKIRRIIDKLLKLTK